MRPPGEKNMCQAGSVYFGSENSSEKPGSVRNFTCISDHKIYKIKYIDEPKFMAHFSNRRIKFSKILFFSNYFFEARILPATQSFLTPHSLNCARLCFVNRCLFRNNELIHTKRLKLYSTLLSFKKYSLD